VRGSEVIGPRPWKGYWSPSPFFFHSLSFPSHDVSSFAPPSTPCHTELPWHKPKGKGTNPSWARASKTARQNYLSLLKFSLSQVFIILTEADQHISDANVKALLVRTGTPGPETLVNSPENLSSQGSLEPSAEVFITLKSNVCFGSCPLFYLWPPAPYLSEISAYLEEGRDGPAIGGWL
jgi:hypothetical protein